MVLKLVKCHHIWRVLKWVMCTNFLNSSESAAVAIYEGSWNESMCTISLSSPKWSWKESVCVAILLVALISAVISMLYSDVVLLYLWLFCLCLGCMGDILLGSIWTLFFCTSWWALFCPWGSPWAAQFSWAPWWTLLFCALWGSLLCPSGSPWAAGDHRGCLSTGCLALYS